MNIKIGSKVWLDGDAVGRQELEVIRETARSWVVQHRYRGEIKIPKSFSKDSMNIPTNYGNSKTLWLDKSAMERADWVNVNGYKIHEKVFYIRDYAVLKRIAEAIGYKE